LKTKTRSQHSHYLVFSPRKFVGVPDGGILLAQDGVELPKAELTPPPAAWWQEAASASAFQAEFDLRGGERIWFSLFRETDPGGPFQPHHKSDLSRFLLCHCVDWAGVARRRRENFALMASALSEFALFKDLPDGVVPVGFPVRLRNRDEVRQALFAEEIYPPVHWPTHSWVPHRFRQSHQLSDEILTLVCDQRYNAADMRRTASIALGHARSASRARAVPAAAI